MEEYTIDGKLYHVYQYPWTCLPDTTLLKKTGATLGIWYKHESMFYDIADFKHLTQYDPFDTNPAMRSDIKDISNFLKSNNITDWLLIDNNYRNQELYPEKCMYFPYFMFGYDYYETPNDSKNVRAYTFSSFNRRPTEARLTIVHHIKNKNSAWSCGKPDDDAINILPANLQETIAILPKHIDTEFEVMIGSLLTPIDLYRIADFHIINETSTFYDPNYMFLTEKTFNCICSRTPFLLAGMPFSLKHLQMLGFKTFGSLWDESYDSILDTNERMKKICSVIDYIEQNTTVLKEAARDIVEFNAEHLATFFAQDDNRIFDTFSLMKFSK
jgi:hypothetical protein